LDGKLNGTPFTISRTKTATKSGLVFQLDGNDLTTQSAKETQAVIEEHLGVSVPILSRTMFHGQHAINELLEATDAKLKEELSLLVPLGLWQAAASLSRAKSREAGKRASEFEGMITMRSQDIDQLAVKGKAAETNVNQRQKNISSLEAQYNIQLSRGSDDRQNFDFQQIESELTGISSELKILEERYRQIQAERHDALEPLRVKLVSTVRSYESLLTIVQQGEREVYAATLNLKMATDKVNEIEQKWSIDLSGGASEVLAPDVCPTCRQPIATTGDGHSHEDLEMIMTQEIDHNIDRRNEAQQSFEMSSKKLEERRHELQVQERERISIESNLQNVELEWKDQIDQLERTMEAKRSERSSLSEKMATVARESQIAAKNEAAMANIKMERASLDYATETLVNIDEEMKNVENRLEEMQGEMGAQKKRVRTMSELADSFGQRGVQTFVLQNVVDVLQSCSQTYLDDLSDGSQRLDLSLDASDRISRTAFVVGADGVFKERPLATLSGGQWRRCSLALTFGFAELVARRGKFRPSMCVLDEPLTHLDRSGRSKVGEVIRKMLRPNDSDGIKGFGVMGMSTVVVILQDLAAEELDEAFDCIDEVIKENSASCVKVDGFHPS
jgi:DNA repair exonuclease SbcCD ATPase subunit